MKKILAVLFAALFSASVFADGIYHDPDRPGEGIAVFDREPTLVFYFFSYGDTGGDRPPTVSPRPPEPDLLQGEDSQAWYFGVASDYDGEEGTGTLYVSRPVGYPTVRLRDGSVADVLEVGTFVIERSATGYTLDVLPAPFALLDSHELYARRWDFSEAVFK